MDPRRTVDVTDTSVVNPYRTAFHQSDVGLALVDRGGRVIDANAAFLALVAASNVPSPPSLVGTPLSRVLPGLEAALGTRAPLTTTIPSATPTPAVTSSHSRTETSGSSSGSLGRCGPTSSATRSRGSRTAPSC